MRIRFTTAVIDREKDAPVLDVIMLFVEENSHVLDQDQPNNILESAWVKGADRRGDASTIRELVRLAIQSSVACATGSKIVLVIDPDAPPTGSVDRNTGEMCVPPLQAIRVLSLPLHVIVENEHGDGAFVLAMAQAFGYRDLRNAYANGLWRFHHAGGCNQMALRAKALSQGVAPVGPISEKQNIDLYMRVLVIMDSDAEHPDDTTDNHREANVCLEFCSKTHVLQKRAIENYLPHYLLAEINRALFNAFKNLNQKQRDYFHIKRGFSTKSGIKRAKIDLSPKIKSLYDDVRPYDWKILQKGFGESAADGFRNHMSNFTPDKFKNIGLDGIAEMHELLSMIRHHL